MSWLKGTLTRAAAGQVVHVVLAVVRPELQVDHVLVGLAVFFAAAISGVGSDVEANDAP
jgi:ABC-type uncharacterized transport system permease subunit